MFKIYMRLCRINKIIKKIRNNKDLEILKAKIPLN